MDVSRGLGGTDRCLDGDADTAPQVSAQIKAVAATARAIIGAAENPENGTATSLTRPRLQVYDAPIEGCVRAIAIFCRFFRLLAIASPDSPAIPTPFPLTCARSQE